MWEREISRGWQNFWIGGQIIIRSHNRACLPFSSRRPTSLFFVAPWEFPPCTIDLSQSQRLSMSPRDSHVDQVAQDSLYLCRTDGPMSPQTYPRSFSSFTFLLRASSPTPVGIPRWSCAYKTIHPRSIIQKPLSRGCSARSWRSLFPWVAHERGRIPVNIGNVSKQRTLRTPGNYIRSLRERIVMESL